MEFKFSFLSEKKQEKAVEREAEFAVKPLNAEDEALVSKVILLECGIVDPLNKLCGGFAEGTEFVLDREPSNQYDRWAIIVKTLDGTNLGYLPMGKNQSTARLMDAGKRVRAFAANASAPEYANALRTFNYNESTLVPLVIYMEIPLRRTENDERRA